MEHDVAMARQFVACITQNANTEIDFAFFDDQKKGRSGLTYRQRKRIYGFEDPLIRVNKMGAGVFMTINETDGKGFRSTNVTRVRALFIDYDQGCIDSFGVEPSVIVTTGKGEHYYWLLNETVPLEHFSHYQKQLIQRHGGDPAVHDLARVMRLPGFWHMKDEPKLVILKKASDTRYSLAQLNLTPPGVTVTTASAPVNIDVSQIPDRLKRAAAYVDRMNGGTSGVDRNNATYEAAAVCVKDFALTDDEALDVLLAVHSHKCNPPTDAEYIRKVVKNAREHGTGQLGSKLTEQRPRAKDRFQATAGAKAAAAPSMAAPQLTSWSRGVVDAESTQGRRELGHVLGVKAIEDLVNPAKKKNEDDGKLTPSEIAAAMDQNEHIICNENGAVFQLKNNVWVQIKDSRLNEVAAQYDAQEHISVNRAKNATLVYRSCYMKTMDRIPWCNLKQTEIPFLDGVYDFETGVLGPHKPEHYLDRCLPHKFPKEAPEPVRFFKALDFWTQGPEQDAIQQLLKEYIGYCLMFHALYKKALFIISAKSDTGKSALAGVLRILVGAHQMSQVPLDQMGSARERAPLSNSLVNLIPESKQGKFIDASGFKECTGGGDYIQIDHKYLKAYPAKNIAKLIIFGNHAPTFEDSSKATSHRMMIVRFDNQLTEEQKDAGLNEAFIEEAPGILRWALEGAAEIHAKGGRFIEPKSVLEEREQLRIANSSLLEFIHNECLLGPSYFTTARAIADGINAYRDNKGRRKETPQSINRAFRDFVSGNELNISPGRSPHTKARVWVGLQLRSPDSPEQGD